MIQEKQNHNVQIQKINKYGICIHTHPKEKDPKRGVGWLESRSRKIFVIAPGAPHCFTVWNPNTFFL